MSDTPWKMFPLSHGKTPLAMCTRCKAGSCPTPAAKEACPHPICHGFYAATDNPAMLTGLAEYFPGHPWAVRTGKASGITVMDFEGDGFGICLAFERFTEWTDIALPETLTSSTPSGGRHLYFRHVAGIKTRSVWVGRLDVKNDGGYVAIPTDGVPGREWLVKRRPAQMPRELADWLRTASTLGSGNGGTSSSLTGQKPDGYSYPRCLAEGAREGERWFFMWDLTFELRIKDTPYSEALECVKHHWSRMEQRDWFWPLDEVIALLDRTYENKTPTPSWMTDWARNW